MDLNVLRVLIESDKNRKLTAFMLYHFWQNDAAEIKNYLISYGTANEMFTAKTAAKLPKVHRDLVNKVLRNTCTLYNTGADRYLTDKDGKRNEKQTELLNEIYEDAGIAQAQKDWYRAGKLFNCVEVKPVWRNVTQKVEFDIWTPNWFTVWENSESKYIKDLILFDIQLFDAEGNIREVQEVWTKDEHYYLVDGKVKTKTTIIDENGIAKKVDVPTRVREAVPGNEAMINPYKINGEGVIPSEVLRFKKGEDYYGIGMLALVEDNIWHDLDIANTKMVKNFQGLGIITAVNFGKAGTIDISPNTILAVDDVKTDQETPHIEAVATNAPIAELDASSKENAENIMLMNGLSGQSATVDNTNAPGISKAFDAEELNLMQLDDKDVLVDFETRLFNIVRVVHNTWNTDPERKLKEDLEFYCDFIDKVTPLNTDDNLKLWEFELTQGLSSKIDYLIEKNPDLDEKAARKILEDNAKLKKEFDTTPELLGNNGAGQGADTAAGLNNPPVRRGNNQEV